MSESSEAARPYARRTNWKPWQFGVRTSLLITAAMAAWTAVYVNRREIASLESRIATMQPLAKELIVGDPAKFAAVKLDSLWMDDDRWDVHIPAGSYRVCLATSGIGEVGLAPALKTAPIASGRHRLALGQAQKGVERRLTVACDGAMLLETAEPAEWSADRSSTGGGHSTSTQAPADKPFELYRRRYLPAHSNQNYSPPPSGVAPSTSPVDHGILLWIEPIEAPKP